jgi:hypothetical protein
MPYFYEAVRGLSYDDVLALIRRWARRIVHLDACGRVVRPAVVIYDYIKLINAQFVTGREQEHQTLGYITSGLKDLMGETGMACLTFAQMNRQGITSEETDAIAGSDRILHYASSLSLFKRKNDEVLQKDDPPGSEKYSHKLIVKKSRFGEEHRGRDYINLSADYARARITEGPSRAELEAKGAGGPRRQEGAVDAGEQSQVEF